MRTWTILAELHIEPFFDKALTKSISGANEAVRKLLALRVECDKQLALLAGCDVLDVTERTQDVKTARLESLKNEVVLRSEIDAIEERVHVALCEARDEALEAHQQAETEVDEALQALGYSRKTFRFYPAAIADHPRVRATHDEVERLGRLTSTRDSRRANATALKVVEGELNREREKVLASA